MHDEANIREPTVEADDEVDECVGLQVAERLDNDIDEVIDRTTGVLGDEVEVLAEAELLLHIIEIDENEWQATYLELRKIMLDDEVEVLVVIH